VRAVADGGTIEGLASSVDLDGALVIDTPGGRVRVNSGEVSVHGIMGYA
jgi:biotin-(acetyl-CoA carboxylase) ligase